MTEIEFDKEIERLRAEFGSNYFKASRLKLIWDYVSDLSQYEFSRIVNGFLGKMRQAPLPEDFREEARNIRRSIALSKFDQNVNGAIQAMGFSNASIQDALAKTGYPGCKTINEAVEVERLKIRISREMSKA